MNGSTKRRSNAKMLKKYAESHDWLELVDESGISEGNKVMHTITIRVMDNSKVKRLINKASHKNFRVNDLDLESQEVKFAYVK